MVEIKINKMKIDINKKGKQYSYQWYDEHGERIGYNIIKRNPPHETTKNDIKTIFEPVKKYVSEYEKENFYKHTTDEDFNPTEGGVEKKEMIMFDDYPEDLKTRAKEIVHSGKSYEYLLEEISKEHRGDKKEIEVALLGVGSIFASQRPAHQQIGGESGGGKTHMIQTILKHVPDYYVFNLRSVSPKYLFYACEKFNEDYNIVTFDDVIDNREIIELLKILTDNETQEKIHLTVNDGEAYEYKLPGKYFIVINSVEGSMDKELSNRLLRNVAKEAESRDNKEDVLNTIVYNTFGFDSINVDYSLSHCIFQYLIENNNQWNNWFVTSVDYEHFGTRSFQHFSVLCNAKTWFNHYSYEQVNRKPTLMKEDMEHVYSLWLENDFKERNTYDLTVKEKKVLQCLPVNESDHPQDTALTIKDIAVIVKETEINVHRYLKGRSDRNKVGLVELGLVKEYVNNPTTRLPNLYYRYNNIRKDKTLFECKDDTIAIREIKEDIKRKKNFKF